MRLLVSFSTLALLAAGCTNEVRTVQASKNRPGVDTRTVELCTDRDATEGFASFVVSSLEGGAVPASDTNITQVIDGEEPGSGVWEGGQSLGVENLTSDLHVTLLLDASNSVVQAGLFDQMKASAEELLSQGAAQWEERPGVFTWQVIWFNRLVNAASDAQGEWEFADIRDIPAPDPDDDAFTRLYAAMEFAIRDATATREEGIADGDRDNHLLAVFTDGGDNISGLPSGDPKIPSDVTKNGKAFDTFGTNSINRAQLERLMENRDWLQVSMLGLGSEIDREALDSLARAGNGTVFEGQDIERLFSRAQQSFEIQQNVGFRLPFNPDEPHVWELDFKVKGIKRPSTIRLLVERTDETPMCEEDEPTTPTEKK